MYNFIDDFDKIKHQSSENDCAAKRFCKKYDRYVLMKADALWVVLYDKNTKKEVKTNRKILANYMLSHNH